MAAESSSRLLLLLSAASARAAACVECHDIQLSPFLFFSPQQAAALAASGLSVASFPAGAAAGNGSKLSPEQSALSKLLAHARMPQPLALDRSNNSNANSSSSSSSAGPLAAATVPASGDAVTAASDGQTAGSSDGGPADEVPQPLHWVAIGRQQGQVQLVPATDTKVTPAAAQLAGDSTVIAAPMHAGAAAEPAAAGTSSGCTCADEPAAGKYGDQYLALCLAVKARQSIG